MSKKTWANKADYEPKNLDSVSQEELAKWVDFCFEAYEADGFRPTYHAVYSDYWKYDFMRFEVLGRVPSRDTDPQNGVDLEVLPMWYIRFEDGTETMAYPEEICLSETSNSNEHW